MTTASAAVGDVAERPHERRDLILLASGMLVSVTGDSAATIALLLELHTHGTGWVAAMLAAELLPFTLLASVSGRLVDRVDNRRLLVAALLCQAAIVVPLALVRSPWAVVALVFALTVAATAVRPAVNAMVPVLAGEVRAVSGYAWIATGSGIGWIAGPALGGVLTASFGVTTALLADAGSFVAIAISCGLLTATRGRAVASHEVPAARHGGMTLVWRDAVLRWSLLATAVCVACAVIDNVAAPFRFLDQLHSSATSYGLYLAFWGLGALLGTQGPRRLSGEMMPAALAVGNVLCGLGILGIGLAPSVAVAFVASVAGGIGNGIANVAMSALIASRAPAEMRGRVFAATGAIVQTGTGVGTLAGAPLVSVLTASRAMVGAGGISAVLALVTMVWSLAVRGASADAPG